MYKLLINPQNNLLIFILYVINLLVLLIPAEGVLGKTA
jgi:hypothetical protein